MGELVDVCSGRDYKHLSEGDIPVYGTGGYMLSVSEALSYDKDAIGIGRKGTIDKPYILNAPFWTVDTLFYAIPKEKVDLNFAFDIFQNINWKKKDESTGVPSLSRTAINEIHILVPQYDEQQVLGQLFYGIDRLIALHQRKLDKMKELKKAFLNLIFSQKLRFYGFTDSWELRKLEEVAPLRGGYAFQSNQYANEGIPIVRISNILSDGSVGGEFVFHNELKDDEIFMLENGDIVLAMSGATTGKVSILSSEKSCKYYQNQRVGLFSKTATCNYSFVATIVRSEKFLEQLRDVLVAGAQPNVSAKDIDAFDFSVPKDVEEQSQIGNFFRTLDRLITLYQRKLDKMKELKKAFLNLIFSQKLRFRGFTESWELRKLKDITYPAGEKNRENLPLDSYSITNEHGFIPQDERFENGGTMRETDKKMYYIVSPHSFAYNPARINIGSIGYQNTDKNVIVSSLYEVFKTSDDVDDRLLWYWFKSSYFQKLIEQFQEGGVRLYFYYDKLCMGTLSLPSFEEQHKIGKYLDTYDNLITLRQEKINQLTKLKTTFLKNMFL